MKRYHYTPDQVAMALSSQTGGLNVVEYKGFTWIRNAREGDTNAIVSKWLAHVFMGRAEMIHVVVLPFNLGVVLWDSKEKIPEPVKVI